MRNEYWSNSKFADFIRGVKKPDALTFQGWKYFDDMAKENNKLRFWIAEELLDKIQNFINYPSDLYHDIIYYIHNRYYTKTHQLTAHPSNIKPGRYMDLDSRLFYCMMNELVNFVEIEKAWMSVAWNNSDNKYYRPPLFDRYFKDWRDPQAGIDYLNWETTLVYESDSKYVTKGEKTQQAKIAETILEIYYWYTQTYKNRPDIYDITGWTDYCDKHDIFDENRSKEDEKLSRDILNEIQRLEREYYEEENNMLKKLIDIRENLWT